MRYENTPQLTTWLSKDFPLLAAMPGFNFDDLKFENHLLGVASRPASERRDAAAFRCLTEGFTPERQNANPSASAIALDVNLGPVLDEMKSIRKLLRVGLCFIVVLLLILFASSQAHAQNSNVAVVVTACGTPPTNIPAASAGNPNRVYLTVDTNGQICINGTITGGNAAASATGAAVPANADYIGVNVGGTLRGATATNTSGAVYAIDTNCVAGCAGGTNDVDDGTIANGQTTGIQLPLNYVYDGTNWKRLTVGTAGSGSTQVTTVQGDPSGTAIPVSGNVVVSQSVASSLNTLAQLTTSSAQIGHLEANQSINLAQANGVTMLMGNGASGTGAIRMTLANDSTGVLATVTNVATIGTSVTPGTAATNLGKAISAVVGATDTGVATLFQRFDTPTTVETTGDYVVPRTDSVGRVWVNCGTGCSGGTQYAIDAVGGATDTGTVALVIRDDALTTLTPADGDYVGLRVNSTGALWTQSSIIDAAEDAAVATNPIPMGGVYRTASVTLDNGDVGYPRIDVDANLQVVGTGTAGTAAGGVLTVQGVASMTPILATVSDGAGALNVICDSGCSGGVQYTQDAALTIATSVGTAIACRASAAVPTGVSADDDAVLTWCLRSGAMAVQPTFGGVLGVAGNGASGTGVQRVTIANDSTGVIAAVTSITNAVTVTDGSGALNVIVDSGTVTTVSTVTTLSQLGGVALPIEDAAETPGGVGIYAMSVRRDTAATSANTTGDNATLNTDAVGALWANIATPATIGVYVEDVGETAAGNLMMAGTVRRVAAVSSAGSTGDNATLNTDTLGLVWGRHLDPCSGVAKTYYVVNLSSAGTTEIANAVSGEFFYICSINIVSAAANNILIAEDDTDGCGSLSAGLNGGTTSATGWNFAANGGISMGNGDSSIMRTGTSNRYFCIAISANTQTSGTISFVSAP